jgi:two-component system sensor histidine kinase RpfC
MALSWSTRTSRSTQPRANYLFSWVTTRLWGRANSESDLIEKPFQPSGQGASYGGLGRERSAGVNVAPSGPLSILIAGSSSANNRVLAETLGGAGYRVVIVDDGNTILDILDVSRFDLFLMDVDMPAMSGIEVTKLYRFISLGQPYVPIIAVVADVTEAESQRCRAAGIDACISMPIEPHCLFQIIEMLVHSARKESQVASDVGELSLQPSAGCSGRTALAIDVSTLNELEKIGGSEFVNELAAEFLEDVPNILRVLDEAAVTGDAETFYQQMHILRSASANIGARGIYDICSAWRPESPENLADQKGTRERELRDEFERMRMALEQLLASVIHNQNRHP